MISASVVLKLAAAAFAALALAGSAEGGPIISAGTGCAVQCIEKALVRPTATSAEVELETTVLAHLTVSVEKHVPGGAGGGLAAPSAVTVHISAFAPSRVARFAGLQPATTYAISVKATDLKGQSNTRRGTFETLPVQTSGQGGPSTLGTGLGCSLQCIEQALFSQTRPAASIANVHLRTATDARIRLVVSLDKPVPTAAGPSQLRIVSQQSSPGLTRSWRTQVGGLLPGTRYWAVVRATDVQGRTSIRQGSFRTVGATAIVTLHKLWVVADGDKGANRGELYFRYYRGGDEVAWNGSFQKIGSGSVVDVRIAGQGRPGLTLTFPANGDAKLDLRVLGEECDNVLKKNCVVEAGGPSTNQYAWAGGVFDLSAVLAGGALPPWYGTGVTPPAGHDGYFVLSSKSGAVAFHVLATVDVKIGWP